MQTKNDIRKEARELREKMDYSVCATNSLQICRRIQSLLWYQHARELLVYAPVNNEADLSELYRRAWTENKKLYFPKIENERMEFYRADSFEELKRGTFGIPEPVNTALKWENNPKNNTCILIPGVAFNESGARIGYGKGYYDTFLAENPALFMAGIAYECQIFRDWQTTLQDVSVETIITERREIII